MLFFFGKNLDFEAIEANRLHKVASAKNRVRELIQLADMLFKHNGTGKIKRLTQLVQNRRPAL